MSGPLRRRARWLVPALLVAAMTAACGGGGSAGTATAVDSVTLVSAFDSATGGWDPGRTPAIAQNDGNIMTALYGNLVYRDIDSGKVVPWLAKSLTPDAAGTNWTLTLRPDLKFSDGTVFDAAAVKANFDRHTDKAQGSYQYPSVVGVTTQVKDPTTLVITLPTPNLNFDQIMSGPLGQIYSPTAYAKDPKGYAVAPVGAGPYVLESWARDSRVVLKKSPTYVDAASVKVATLTVNVLPDLNQALNTVRSGQADIMVQTSPKFADDAKSSGLAVSEYPLSGIRGWMMNLRSPAFSDVRARQAVAYAVNLDELTAVIAPSEKTAPKSLFAANSPFFTDVRPATDDKAKAQQLFDTLAAEGKPVNFTIMSTQSGSAEGAVAEAIQARLSQFKNVTVAVRPVTTAAYTDAVNNTHSWDMTSFQLSYPDPEPQFYSMLHTGTRQNKFGYSSPEMDAALDAGRQTADPAKRAQAYATAQQLAAREVIMLGTNSAAQRYAHSKRLGTKLPAENDGVIRFDLIGTQPAA
ncbi:glutathione ABC transporter substrate-binding protein GsiB [Pseudonocardia ailaonensis]|uniref:Glutathione ABC transporter substrate-binding protein GsiB n=1 Tax=Pseudonocardia ailaonensis TaxID=367279 RepID=A0ABN2MHK7_9PSEU